MKFLYDNIFYIGLIYFILDQNESSREDFIISKDQIVTKSKEFDQKLKKISLKSGINLNLLFFHLWAESGIKPESQDPKNSRAGGIFGLLPYYSKPYLEGKSFDEFLQMSDIEQLDIFDKWLRPFYNKIKTPHEMRLAGFAPAYFDKRNDDNFVIGKEGSETVLQNSHLDTDKDGKITMGELRKRNDKKWKDFLKLKTGSEPFKIL